MDKITKLRQTIINFGKKAPKEDLQKFYEIYLILEESKKKNANNNNQGTTDRKD